MTDWDAEARKFGAKADAPIDWDAEARKFRAKPTEQQPGALANLRGAYVDPLLAMATGMVAKPASDIAGLASIPLHAAGIINTQPEDVQSNVRRDMTYEPKTEAGQAITEYNPLALLSRGVDWAGGKAEQGINAIPATGTMRHIREAAGQGIHEAVNQAPGFLGVKAPAGAALAAQPVKQFARQTMQSALKPPIAAQQSGRAARAVDVLLDEGVNVSQGGANKLRGRVDAINDQITAAIDSSPATINKQAVGYRLQDTVDKFSRQVAPLTDISSIQKVWDQFLDHPMLGDQIPVKTAQELKQGTYRSLKDKAYGELKGADMEAQKTLARGLKEEIASAVPEVRQLNAAESRLLDALPLVERRALMEANKNPAGLGWLTLNPAAFAAWMADRSGAFKSLVARMTNTQAETVIPAMGRAAMPAGLIASQGGGLLSYPEDDERPRRGLLGRP